MYGRGRRTREKSYQGVIRGRIVRVQRRHVAFVRAAASLLSDGIRRTESHVKKNRTNDLVFTYLLVSFYLALHHASYSIYLFGIAP